MTEGEWRAATDPTLMLEFLSDKASERKLRLFAVACCRRITSIPLDVRCCRLLDTAERIADREIGRADWIASNQEAVEVMMQAVPWEGHCWHVAFAITMAVSKAFVPLDATRIANCVSASVLTVEGWEKVHAIERESGAHADLLRDIFGTHFQLVTFNPSWLTSTVLALSHQMYNANKFTSMPVLAAALQDAGCDNEDVLNHCRQTCKHVKGCWVVDRLLSRE